MVEFCGWYQRRISVALTADWMLNTCGVSVKDRSIRIDSIKGMVCKEIRFRNWFSNSANWANSSLHSSPFWARFSMSCLRFSSLGLKWVRISKLSLLISWRRLLAIWSRTFRARFSDWRILSIRALQSLPIFFLPASTLISNLLLDWQSSTWKFSLSQ